MLKVENIEVDISKFSTFKTRVLPCKNFKMFNFQHKGTTLCFSFLSKIFLQKSGGGLSRREEVSICKPMDGNFIGYSEISSFNPQTRYFHKKVNLRLFKKCCF